MILISPCRAHHRISFKGLVFAKKATVTASPSLPHSFSAVWIILLVCKFWCEGMHHFNIQNAPTASTLVILKKSFVSFICESLIHVIVISKLLTVGTRKYLLLKGLNLLFYSCIETRLEFPSHSSNTILPWVSNINPLFKLMLPTIKLSNTPDSTSY